MTLTQEQLEWIVSEVVRRLRATATSDAAPAGAGTLNVAERLVTLETLRGRLTGVARVQVAAKAIVTPAVVDMLKENQVELLRD